MLFMNQWEIEMALQQHANHPILSKATKLLHDLMELTNSVSDGWHSWPKPCRAAKKLQEMIQNNRGRNSEFSNLTEADLKKAIAPIKALLTREAKSFQGHTLNFPC
jgi:hypothetical protein